MSTIQEQITKSQWFQRNKRDPEYMAKRRRLAHIRNMRTNSSLVLSEKHTSWPQPGQLGFETLGPKDLT